MREEIRDTGIVTGFVFYAFIIILVLATIGGTWALFFNRKAMPYQEETRRRTYQQSATTGGRAAKTTSWIYACSTPRQPPVRHKT